MEDSDPVFVPVRASGAGCCAVRICRRPDGIRTGVAFSSSARLDRVLGMDAPRVVLSLAVLRASLAEVGVAWVQLDPELWVAAAPAARACASGS